MSDQNNKSAPTEVAKASRGFSRKSFLKYAGASAAAAATFGLVGCNDDNPTGGGMNKTTVNFGSGDIGILNTAYALEQLEAAFYAKAAANIQSGSLDFGGDVQNNAIMAIAQHENAHMLWFKAVLNAKAPDQMIPSLADFLDFDKASVDFTDATSVLTNAHALEETGVGAYNGAGQYIQNDAYLTQAGKIVSVEARHTAIINSFLKPGDSTYFAEDVMGSGSTKFGIDENGLDNVLTVEQAVTNAAGYLNTDDLEIDYSQVGK